MSLLLSKQLENKLILYHKDVVIGSSFEALLYSYYKKIPFIFTKVDEPLPYDDFEYPHIPFKITIPLKTLTSPTSIKKDQISKLKLWQYLFFFLGLRGFSLSHYPFASIKIENEYIKGITEHGRMVKIKYDKVFVFDDHKVQGMPFPKYNHNFIYKVYDYIKINKRLINPYDFLETNDDLIKELKFVKVKTYKHIKKKNAVAISYLTDEQLQEYEYSNIAVRFKTLHLMKQAGLRVNNANKTFNTAVKLTMDERIIVPFGSKHLYDDTDRIVFIKDDYKTILNEYCFSYQPLAKKLYKLYLYA